MRKAALILLLAPSAALAQNRGGDAALGALSGAVVLGPVGAVAGAVIGYTAGPAIAHSWGFNRQSAPPPRQRSGIGGSRPAEKNARVATSRSETISPVPSAAPSAPEASAALPAPVATTTPPMQTLE